MTKNRSTSLKSSNMWVATRKIITFLLVAGLGQFLSGCETIVEPKDAPTSQQQDYTVRPYTGQPDKKTGLAFQTKEQADAYAANFQNVMRKKGSIANLLKLSNRNLPDAVSKALIEGKPVKYITTRTRVNADGTSQSRRSDGVGPQAANTEVMCQVAYCTDWYLMVPADGSLQYLGESCQYAQEPCSSDPMGTGHTSTGVIGSNPTGGGGGTGSGPISTGSVNFNLPFSGFTNVTGSVGLLKGKIMDVSTGLSGLTVGLDYAQVRYDVVQTTPTAIDFTVTYRLSLTLFVNGIGTVYTYPNETMQFRLNKSTGIVTGLL